jgi:hypothetical protein
MGVSLLATLGLDGASFESNLLAEEAYSRKMGKKIKDNLSGGGASAFESGMNGLVKNAAWAYVATKAIQGVQSALEMAHNVKAISEDIGASAENVQVYLRAFDGAADVTAAFKSLAEAREKALGNGADATQFVREFDRLGVSVDQLKSKNMDGLFQQIGAGIKDAAIDGQELADVASVLGKGGVQDLHAEMVQKQEIMSSSEIQDLELINRKVKELEANATTFMDKLIIGMDYFLTWDKSNYGVKKLDPYDIRDEMSKRREQTRAAAVRKQLQEHVDAAAEIAKINDKTADLEFRQLSNDEKRIQLTKERAAIEKTMQQNLANSNENDAAAVKQATLKEQLEKVKLELADLKEDKPNAPEKASKEQSERKVEHLDVNAAQRVGAYAYQASGVDLQQKSVGILTKISTTLDEIKSRGGYF